MGNTNKIINKIVESNRLFEVLYDGLSEKIKSSKLYNRVSEYLDLYSELNNLDVEYISNVYFSYITIYNKHCKKFAKSGLYPHEYEVQEKQLSRVDYDIILILSVLLTEHRFRIMELLSNKSIESGDRLFIGAGPGLELLITKSVDQRDCVYDLEINSLLKKIFSDTNFYQEFFDFQYKDFFDSIFLIEILEHIEDPFELLKNCYLALKKQGIIYLTTATDIPQFDHLYNFPVNHDEFESKLLEIGYKILYKEKINHNYLIMSVEPSNHFYIIQKL